MTLLMTSTFVSRLCEVAVALSLIVLRRKKPDLDRPFKMWGYPVTTILAAVVTFVLVCNVAPAQIKNSLILMATSIPAFFIFRATVGKKAKEQANAEQ